MGATAEARQSAAEAQVAKKCYRNQTAGWLGVVTLDHLGAQAGISIEPYGTVYLSDEEAVLTARAPKDPKDNPFVEQMFEFRDERGQRVDKMMRPLVLVEDPREVPSNERFVPGQTEAPVQSDLNLHSVAANARTADEALAGDADRPVPTEAVEPAFAPASTAAVSPSHATAAGSPLEQREPEEEGESWTENPERTEEPQPAALGGSNEPAPGAVEGSGASEAAPGKPSQRPAPQAPPQASSSVESSFSQHGEPNASESSGTGKANGGAVEQGAAEEHAGVTPAGEETGAAQTAEGEAPEGEFARHEEVGSPEAPNQAGEGESQS